MDFKLQHTIHERQETAHDLYNLEKRLKTLLRGKLEGKSRLNTLNLACGRADETGVLAQVLAEKCHSAHIQGLDLREKEIAQAQQLWAPALETLTNGTISCEFTSGKGHDTEQWKGITAPDLVFIRHQNYWFDQDAWTKLYDQGLEKLKHDGVMVITSYFDQEHEMARQVLQALGATEIAHHFNPFSRKVKDSVKLVKTVDRHISLFVKVG